MSTDGRNKGAAFDLVQYLTTTERQLAFAKACGVMPSLQSAAEGYRTEFPEMEAFLDGAQYAQNLPTNRGASEVMRDVNAQLEGLKSGSPQQILDSAQRNFGAIATG